MRISAEQLSSVAAQTGFRADVLEKSIQLLGLLDALRANPALAGRLALKGGTALNVFYLEVPRLSVDIDLNYITSAGRNEMLTERPSLEDAIRAVCSREGFSVERVPREHAGGKWRLRYAAAAGGSGNLELDINFMYRVPLWDAVEMDSKALGPYQASNALVMDIHEIAAGKLAALLSRHQARDLFDSNLLVRLGVLDLAKLRLAFVVYGAGNRRDWRKVSPQDIQVSERDIKRQLIPTLNRRALVDHGDISGLGKRLIAECRDNLSAVLPFSENEMRFLDLLLDEGVVEPRLLSDDPAMRSRIENNPMIRWKAENVIRYKGGRG